MARQDRMRLLLLLTAAAAAAAIRIIDDDDADVGRSECLIFVFVCQFAMPGWLDKNALGIFTVGLSFRR